MPALPHFLAGMRVHSDPIVAMDQHLLGPERVHAHRYVVCTPRGPRNALGHTSWCPEPKDLVLSMR